MPNPVAVAPKLSSGPISIPGGPEGAIIPQHPAVETPQQVRPSVAQLAEKEAATRIDAVGAADILAQTVASEGPRAGLQELASGGIEQQVEATRPDALSAGQTSTEGADPSAAAEETPREPTTGEKALNEIRGLGVQVTENSNVSDLMQQLREKGWQDDAEGKTREYIRAAMETAVQQPAVQEENAPTHVVEALNNQASSSERPQPTGQNEQQTTQPTTAVRAALNELGVTTETFDRLLELSEQRGKEKGPREALREFTNLYQQKAKADGKDHTSREFLMEAQRLFYELKATHYVDSGMPKEYKNHRTLKKQTEEEIRRKANSAKLQGREITPEEEREAKIAALSAFMMDKDFAPTKNLWGWVINAILYAYSQLDAFFKGLVPQAQQ